MRESMKSREESVRLAVKGADMPPEAIADKGERNQLALLVFEV
jgi:hypothetical protein